MSMTITLTRHYSGFQNRDDHWTVGDDETTDSSVSQYLLPDGYSIDGDVIRDKYGCQCEIIEHTSGKPQLISLAGAERAQPVLVMIAD